MIPENLIDIIGSQVPYNIWGNMDASIDPT